MQRPCDPLRRIFGGVTSVVRRHDQVRIVSVKRVGLQRIPDPPRPGSRPAAALGGSENAVVLPWSFAKHPRMQGSLVGIAQVNHEQSRMPLGHFAQNSMKASTSVREPE